MTPSATAADLTAATAAITGGLPADAVLGTQTYLDLKAGVDRIADLYVPVLLAFSIFAMLAAAFLIANIVTGVILTSYRDIGVMKAIGYTPGQVSTILAGQVLAPAIVGVGRRGRPRDNRQPAVDPRHGAGLRAADGVQPLGAGRRDRARRRPGDLPARGDRPRDRAGRISAVAAMTRGGAPTLRDDGGRLRRLGLALPIGLPGRLGASAGLARPARASMTLGALVVGVAAATFALGLNWSLLQVKSDLDRDAASPVRVEVMGPGEAGGKTAGSGWRHARRRARARTGDDPATITTAIASDPDTARSVTIGQLDVTLPGMAAIPFVGYQGDSDWLGYALIEGRWFAGPGEAVAPTYVFTRSGLHVGDQTTITAGGRSIKVTLVGEIFDTPRESDDNLVLRGSWTDLATLDPSIQPSRWEAKPAAGVDVQDYRSSLQDAIGPGAWVPSKGTRPADASFLLFLSVVGRAGRSCWSGCRSAACSTRCCSRRASGHARWPCSRRSA